MDRGCKLHLNTPVEAAALGEAFVDEARAADEASADAIREAFNASQATVTTGGISYSQPSPSR